MTMKRSQTIECPQCKTKASFTVYQTVNVTLDPSLKDALLDGELWTHKCPSCGDESRVVFGLLYHDMGDPSGPPGSSIMITLTFDEDFDPEELDAPMKLMPGIAEHMDKIKTRVVGSQNALVEKIHLHDAGLDDRTMEVLKAGLRRQEPSLRDSELRYNGRDDDSIGFVVLSGGEPRNISVDADYFDHLHEAMRSSGLLADMDKVRWARVDEAFGDKVVGGQAEN